MKNEIQVMQKQVNVYQNNLKDMDATILCLEELIDVLNSEAVVGESLIEETYENLHEVTNQRTREESKLMVANAELELLLCREEATFIYANYDRSEK